jgi:hypothetical protein
MYASKVFLELMEHGRFTLKRWGLLDAYVLLAELLDTTVDYLLTGNNEDASPLHSIRLLERFKALEKFEVDDQETVIKLIDAMIVKKQVEGVIQPHLKG